MRKITQQAIEAFKRGRAFKLGNTRIFVYEGNGERRTSFLLHEHEIGEIIDGNTGKIQLFISNCGFKTNTTKERLNGILKAFDLGSIYQKNFEWFYSDKNGNTEPFERMKTFTIEK